MCDACRALAIHVGTGLFLSVVRVAALLVAECVRAIWFLFCVNVPRSFAYAQRACRLCLMRLVLGLIG